MTLWQSQLESNLYKTLASEKTSKHNLSNIHSNKEQKKIVNNRAWIKNLNERIYYERLDRFLQYLRNIQDSE